MDPRRSIFKTPKHSKLLGHLRSKGTLKKKNWKKKVVHFSIYLVYFLLLLEVCSRGLWAVRYGVPFFESEKIIYAFYPELREVEQEEIRREDGYFDILLLGGSVLNDRFGSVRQILLEKLTLKTIEEVRVHNLAVPAHTSLDSYYKYRRLLDKNFDLVLFYHGINEVRANNSPRSLFKKDYSHFTWYERINELEKHREISLIAFPYTLKFLLLVAMHRIGLSEHTPVKPTEEWAQYGDVIKTAASFEENLTSILRIADRKKEGVLLMTFAYYIPGDYSLIKFNNKALDYGKHSKPIEIWGKPANVAAGITTHNEIIKDVARRYNHVSFIDQNMLIPKSGQYFDDIAHFTCEGSESFVDNVLEAIPFE